MAGEVLLASGLGWACYSDSVIRSICKVPQVYITVASMLFGVLGSEDKLLRVRIAQDRQ
jgi:hypothetical protein